MRHLIVAASLALTLTLPLHALAAGVPTPADLPRTEQALAVIDQDPSVVQARHGVQAATHSAAMLEASANEWTAGASAQRRRVDGAGNSNEWAVRLERTIRIGGKAGLDRDLGQAGLRQSQAQLGAARVEVARSLVTLWLDWLTARQTRAGLEEQGRFAQASMNAVEKRRKAGDASALELTVAKGDLAEVQRQVNAAAAAETRAQATLRIRFPSLPLVAIPLSEPVLIEGTETQWRERVAAASDILVAAKVALRKAELSAERARAGRMPDPTVGVYTASEGFRSEQIVGLSLSIPLSGTYRDQNAREALQQVEIARSALERQRRDLDVEVAVLVGEAIGSIDRWRLAEQSATAASEGARLAQRAYTLGETDLQALLMVRRQSMDAVNAAVAARSDALRARYKLLIDARRLWNLEDN